MRSKLSSPQITTQSKFGHANKNNKKKATYQLHQMMKRGTLSDYFVILTWQDKESLR